MQNPRLITVECKNFQPLTLERPAASIDVKFNMVQSWKSLNR